MKLRTVILSALFSIAVMPLFAQTHAHEVGFQSDNDSFLGQGSDRYYTNGLYLFYRQALTVKIPNTSLANKILGIEAGQKIFNPFSGYVPNPTLIDRPFAGYLYAGGNLNWLYKNESNLKVSAQVGVTGPAALGKEAQNVIHNTFGFYELAGWEHQIRNSFQLNLSAEYNKLLARASWIDLSGSAYANLGTGFNGAGIGPVIRAGDFNQLFNSVSTQSSVSRNSSTAPLHQHEFFAYYKPMFNYVAYDATIQGGLFSKDDKTGTEITDEPKHAVFSNEVGVAYSGSRFVLKGDIIFRSKEIEDMRYSQQWGSVTILYKFN